MKVKSLKHIGMLPASLPLSADDILEFHAARLLLLLKYCGVSGRIDGLTKMAKLDFFSRYPAFFKVARSATAAADQNSNSNETKDEGAIESAMVRHHYGPWDKRYYHVLAYLEAKQLICISKDNSKYRLELTSLGNDCIKTISKRQSFLTLIDHMRQVKKAFGNKSGNTLKKLIYKLFEKEITSLSIGKVIIK